MEGELVEITDDWFLIKTKLVAEDKEESVIWIRKDVVALVTSSSTKLAREPLQFPGGVAPTFIAPPAGETNE